MHGRHLFVALLAASILILGAPAQAQSASHERLLDHRDDFRMNSISGGDFRSYIAENIQEDDLWAHAMRTFGSFHDHMHVMMSNLARHGGEEVATPDEVPDFGARISGGGWGEYRENLEEAEYEGPWRDFVQITEIMHDRVHHAMHKSVVYDLESRDRPVDLRAYVPEERAPHPTHETIVPRMAINVEHIDMNAFRLYVWEHDFEQQYRFNGVQNMNVFSELLSELLTRWAEYGATKADPACHPPEHGIRVTPAHWAEYAHRIDDCSDARWREFVQVADLMQARIHHMMYEMVRYDAIDQGRLEQVRQLLH